MTGSASSLNAVVSGPAGFVLRSAPGHPAFPVRLAQGQFLRRAAHPPAGRSVTPFLGRVGDMRGAW